MNTTRCHTLIRLLLSCLLLVLLTVAASAAETVSSGNCGAEGNGSNLTWTLDSDGVLTINGSGKMNDYSFGSGGPWNGQSNSVKMARINSGVTSIGDSAFYGCNGLTSITIPESVMSIGRVAFYNCSSLTSITLPDSVASIGNNTFSNCTSLTSITIPSSMTSTGIGTFEGCTGLTSVTIPDNVTSIDISALSRCSGLTSVTIPDSVTSIDTGAFNGCSSLTSITIPDSVRFIGYNAFEACTNLASITIGNGVTSIDGGAFGRCSSLTSVVIPDSVTCIGESAFYDCTGLTSITIPNRVTSVGEDAFSGCTGLTSVAIPASVTSIASNAFYGCTGIKAVYYSGSESEWNAISISSEGNDALKNVRIYYDATMDDYYYHLAFGTCGAEGDGSNLTWTLDSDGVLTISGTGRMIDFYPSDDIPWVENKESIKTVCIDSGVMSISGSAFSGCSNLAGITLSDSVTSIGGFAFYGCGSLTSIAIPVGVTSIGESAFYGCTGLKAVYYAGSESEWNAISISSTGNDALKNAKVYYNTTMDDHCYSIRVKVSDGGSIQVDKDTAKKGDIITVTAAPDAGYELDAIYVDGVKLEENTFVVTGNHEVSAVFTKLPVYGGTQDYRLEGITVQTTAGEKLQELAREKLLVSVSVRHMQGTDEATVMLAQYDAEGRYQGLVWLTLDEMPLDMALKVTLPVDNSDGKIVNLKAFVVGSLLSPAPVGSAVSFGDV